MEELHFEESNVEVECLDDSDTDDGIEGIENGHGSVESETITCSSGSDSEVYLSEAEEPTDASSSSGSSDVQHIPRTKGRAADAKRAVDAWSCLFTDEILEIVVLHTNEEIRRFRNLKLVDDKLRSLYCETDLIELKAFIGLIYCEGAKKVSQQEFNLKLGPHSYPWCEVALTRERFEVLQNCLRFDDKYTRFEKKKDDCFTHIREIWNMFIWNCRENYVPGKNCTVDEQFLSFCGRCIFKTYRPVSPVKYGLKIFCINDSETHYMFDAIPYVGDVKDKDENESLPNFYLRKLSESIHGSGRNITCDNWIKDVSICDKLKEDYGLTFVGSILQNKWQTHAIWQRMSAPKGESYVQLADGTVLVSTLHTRNVIDNDTGKSNIALFYNKNKGATNSFDQKCQEYSTVKKTLRWPMRVFYGMLDQARVNSFILDQLNNGKSSIGEYGFLQELIDELVGPLLFRQLKETKVDIATLMVIRQFFHRQEIIKRRVPPRHKRQ